MNLEILYRDDFLIAVNKPNGLLVHKTKLAAKIEEFALQTLRNQIGMRVFPTHRLDRKTSGVLLFALDEDTNRKMQLKFAMGEVEKKYTAIVRGFTPDTETIDYALKKEDGKLQQAITHFSTIQRAEINIALGMHQTSRYSLVEIHPITGRMHQIRKHFAHILHPVIGDRPHGCNKQNRFFKEKWIMTTLLLHALSIGFNHPESHDPVFISAPYPAEFNRMLDIIF